VHSRYQRSLADPAIGGRQTLLKVRIRRFFCDNTACRRRTFAEQVPGVTTPYARRTPLLRGILEKVALALGGRPGARMTRLLAVEVSRSTLLRLVRALPVPEAGTVPVVGVDDFAFRKGCDYGSIIVDMRTGRPVDGLSLNRILLVRARRGQQLLKLADDQQQARTGRFAGQPVRDHVTDRLTPHSGRAGAVQLGQQVLARPGHHGDPPIAAGQLTRRKCGHHPACSTDDLSAPDGPSSTTPAGMRPARPTRLARRRRARGTTRCARR
jgi:hypothetical protein